MLDSREVANWLDYSSSYRGFFSKKAHDVPMGHMNR